TSINPFSLVWVISFFRTTPGNDQMVERTMVSLRSDEFHAVICTVTSIYRLADDLRNCQLSLFSHDYLLPRNAPWTFLLNYRSVMAGRLLQAILKKRVRQR